MKLNPNLGATTFEPPRGDGDASVPDTGRFSLPASRFWSKPDVLAEQGLRYETGKLFLGRVDRQMIGLLDNRHIVTVAGSRSGKSACLLTPNLLLYPGPAFVLDPKGELAEATAVHRAKSLGHKVIILDPFSIVKGEAADYLAGHDPMRELSVRSPDLIDDAAAVAEALVLDTGGDSHWTMAARNLLSGLILFAKLVDGRRTLADIRHALATDPAALWEAMSECAPADGDPPLIRDALSIVQAHGMSFRAKQPKEASSIISTALEQLAFLQSPPLRDLFGSHDVDLDELKAGSADGRPVTLYMVLPAGRVATHNRWLRLLVTLALLKFERNRAALPFPVLMILEEFAALGHLRPVEQAAGFIAGSGVRLWSVLQDLTQLKQHYQATWETFVGNAGVIQAFSVSDLTTCKYLSERLGDTTLEIRNKTDAGSQMLASGDLGFRREFRSVPLLSPAEIAIEFARRSDGKGGAAGGPILILVPGAHPFAVERVFHGDLVHD